MTVRLASVALAAAVALAAPRAQACLSSGDQHTINALFSAGGAGTVVSLCKGAKLALTGAIRFSAPDQELSTQGYPKGGQRATLVVTGPTQSIAILGDCPTCSGVKVRNVVVDGNRPKLGAVICGFALLEMGGANAGQVIDHVRAFEPRGWSTLHVTEGPGLACSGAQVTNNHFGPAGHLRYAVDAAGHPILDCNGNWFGEWADGISFSCNDGLVENNTVTDATDGAIVVFGAPGSHIVGNTVVAKSRTLMGAINMVDYAPFDGDYTGTVVSGNTIDATGAMIKVGIAIGPPVWGDTDPTHVNSGGTVEGNVFNGSSFGYPIAVAGVSGFTVRGNVNAGPFILSRGTPSTDGLTQPPYACPTASLPPQPWVFDPSTASGDFSGQEQLVAGPIDGLICNQPTLADSVTVPAGELGLTFNTGVRLDTGYLILQSDGNLVMYLGAPGGAVTAAWASNTAGACLGACVGIFQGDGNLVLYDDVAGVRTPYWATNTDGRGKTLVVSGHAPHLTILDAGGGVVYSSH
jgi:hypothetical protein